MLQIPYAVVKLLLAAGLAVLVYAHVLMRIGVVSRHDAQAAESVPSRLLVVGVFFVGFMIITKLTFAILPEAKDTAVPMMLVLIMLVCAADVWLLKNINSMRTGLLDHFFNQK